jgi:hypothetical protein
LFIVYANGCQTGAYENADGMGQVAVNGKHGAVAYIGNSRDGWIPGPTTAIQHSFFDAMKTTDRLGLLHDARLQLVSANTDHDTRWNVFTLNLFGDPEMKIWKRSPSQIFVKWHHIEEESKIVIHVLGGESESQPVAGALIRIRQGHHSWTTTTSDTGEATLEVIPHGIGQLNMTITAPHHAPHVQSFAIPGAGWIRGQIVSLEHRGRALHEDSAADTRIAIMISDPDENRGKVLRWTLPSELPSHFAFVASLAQALASKTPISLYVTDRNGSGEVTGFRLASASSDRLVTPAAQGA